MKNGYQTHNVVHFQGGTNFFWSIMEFNSNIFSTPISKVKGAPNLRWSKAEVNSPHRGFFSKDRDRILYSKSFLRLRSKTQVFMLQRNDIFF